MDIKVEVLIKSKILDTYHDISFTNEGNCYNIKTKYYQTLMDDFDFDSFDGCLTEVADSLTEVRGVHEREETYYIYTREEYYQFLKDRIAELKVTRPDIYETDLKNHCGYNTFEEFAEWMFIEGARNGCNTEYKGEKYRIAW